MDPYSTHLEAIVTHSLEAEGDMLELGCGYYSTPQLLAVAKYKGVSLDVVSGDPVWSKRFNDVRVIQNWGAWKPSKKYGFCLLDNEQLTRHRIELVPMLLTFCSIVLMHDVDKVAFRDHDVRRPDKVYKDHIPHTGVWYA